MSLVGDIIMELRSRIPDAPAVMNTPETAAITGTTIPGGFFFPGETIYVSSTGTNIWGETTASGPITTTITAGQNAAIVYVYPPGNTAAVGINLYWAGDTDLSNLTSYVIPPNAPNPIPFVLGVQLGAAAQPPNRSTAFLPDTDGNFIGGFMAYRLLNRAIAEMVKIAGGIIDVTGVQSQINQSMYRIDTPNGQGSFYTFTNAWYDGYPMDVVQRSMMYLRNSAAGFSGILSYEQDGPSSVIQVWPQSNRTGGQANLLGQVEATANSFVVGAGGNGFLSIGLCQIDDEVMAFSQVQTVTLSSGAIAYQFNGVTRGMGGSTPAVHIPGSIVTELNIRLSGYRMPPIYQVGDSAKTLMVPQAWETPLVLHMLSQVRSMEQDDAAAEKLLTDFIQLAEKIAKGSRLGKIKPRQIPIWGQNVSDARNVNGIGFGWLIN